MKLLLVGTCLALLLMLFSRLLDGLGARHPVSLDGLATLELPTAFHLADSPERALPVARRLLRRPYVDFQAFADRLTYYLPAHERPTFGGEVVPVVLRVTLYADDAPLPDAPDSTYLAHLVAENYHYDGQQRALYAQLAPAGEHLYYTESQETVVGWFSATPRRMWHLLLTDPANHARLFLSAREDELTRSRAEQLLRDAQRSLRRDPAALAAYFANAGPVVRHREAVEQTNVEANLASFNRQLAAAGLPLLQPVARYAPGRFVEAGPYFYGLNSYQEIYFACWLGSARPGAVPAEAPYFGNANGRGMFLPAFQQQALGQRGVPAGHELLVRTSSSEALWFPPGEVARFQLPDLLREAAESAARVRRHPGFVPATPPPAPVRWELSQATEETRAELEARVDYRHQRLRFTQADHTGLLLSYLGERTPAGQPAEAVFVLEGLDGSVRTRPVAADAQYLAVDAARGSTLPLTVAGRRYWARIEPSAQGYLTVTAQ